MKIKLFKSKQETFISCTSCGTRIRRRRDVDAPSICLRCFYELLNRKLTERKNVRHEAFASDR